MGHYLSEMESPDEAERRLERAARIARLRASGYQFHNVGEVVYHDHCGLVVFNPEVHDHFCPAKQS